MLPIEFILGCLNLIPMSKIEPVLTIDKNFNLTSKSPKNTDFNVSYWNYNLEGINSFISDVIRVSPKSFDLQKLHDVVKNNIEKIDSSIYIETTHTMFYK